MVFATAQFHKCDHERFPCSKCDEKFTTEEEQEQHMRYAHPVIITCEICDRKFTTMRNKKRHIMSVHASASFPCNQCDMICNRKDILETHKKRKHGQSNPMYPKGLTSVKKESI